MFGLGKNKEAGKAKENAEKSGSDDIQFDFDEGDKLPFDEDESFSADEEFEEPPSGRKALPKRTVILLGIFLLLILGGGGYYFLNSSPAPVPSKPAAPVKDKVKVKVQQPAAAPAAGAAATAKQPTAAPAAGAAATVKQPTATPAPGAAATTKSPPPAAPAAPAAKEQTVTVAKPAPVAKVVTPAPGVAAPAVKKEVVTPAAVPATPQPFILSAGNFVNQKQQRQIEKKIRRLGYTPELQATTTKVKMTRLLLGIYSPEDARNRSKELAPLIPDLFSLPQGSGVALYAGSYQNLDRARVFIDKLYQQGILADEEEVVVRLPSKKISFGSFATQAEAEEAARSAIAAGLPAHVVKR